VHLLTVNGYVHILDKTIHDFENLPCGYPSFVLCQSVQPLQYRLDILPSEIVLWKIYCIYCIYSE
jgi:hypothetical protein